MFLCYVCMLWLYVYVWFCCVLFCLLYLLLPWLLVDIPVGRLEVVRLAAEVAYMIYGYGLIYIYIYVFVCICVCMCVYVYIYIYICCRRAAGCSTAAGNWPCRLSIYLSMYIYIYIHIERERDLYIYRERDLYIEREAAALQRVVGLAVVALEVVLRLQFS